MSWQTFCKGQIGNILGFWGHVVPAGTIQLCHYSTKEAIDNMQTNRCGHVSIHF